MGTLHEDAEDVVRAEAFATLDSPSGTDLDSDVWEATSLQLVKLPYLRFFLKVTEDETPQPAARDPFCSMMKTARTQATQVHWPQSYPAGPNQRTRDIINSLLSNLRSDPVEYGGFCDKRSVNDAENQFFWRVITELFAPHAAKMAASCCHIPPVFLTAAYSTCSCPEAGCIKTCLKVAGKEITQELCTKHRDLLTTILGKADVNASRFKFSFYIGWMDMRLAKRRRRRRRRKAASSMRSQIVTDIWAGTCACCITCCMCITAACVG